MAIAKIVFKDEGIDEDGRLVGPASAEYQDGSFAGSFDWVTIKEAENIAQQLGVPLLIV